MNPHQPPISLALLQSLVACRSVTPNDAGCQDIVAARLKPLGFNCETMVFGEVTNLWAYRGHEKPLLVFVGHTDVVPTGPESDWRYPPFTPTLEGDYLYGRGSADMKSGIAAMVSAVEQFIGQHPQFCGSLGFLLTSDEEGPAIDGTRKVISVLQERDMVIDYCVVGEPSAQIDVGDTIKIGRRGSLGGHVIIRGKQGHIAYPEKAKNPIHQCLAGLKVLTEQEWDKGYESFPPTSFQISNIHAGTGALNVIPGIVEIDMNFRYSPASDVSSLKRRVEEILRNHNLNYDILWTASANPYITAPGKLCKAADRAIAQVMGKVPQHSTSGGTSDGRFIAPTGAEVVEIGLCNETIHQVDEHIRVEEMIKLTEIYKCLLEKIFLERCPSG